MLGTEIVKQLIDKNAKVSIFDKKYDSNSRLALEMLLEKCRFIQGDITDREAVNGIIKNTSPEIIIHLAGKIPPEEESHELNSLWETNIQGTWVLLESCRKYQENNQGAKIKKIILASSELVYKQDNQEKKGEDSPLGPSNPYSCSKLAADILAQTYSKTYKLPITILRCSSFYGPGDANPSHLIYGAVSSALSGKAPVIKGNGETKRCFTYVEDMADAFVKAGENQSSDLTIYNISSSEQISIAEIVKKIINISGKDVNYSLQFDSQKQPQTNSSQMDSSLAKEQLSWEEKTTLEQGLEKTISWYKNYFFKESSPSILLTKESIPVVLFVGGLGSRLREETYNKPKPMVEVGNLPLVWHVMKIYRHYGFNRFILTLGYKGEYIREYLAGPKGRYFSQFSIELVETGSDTPTGGRLLKVAPYLNNETFMATYGDGVSDINIQDLMQFHNKKKREMGIIGTITGVHLNHNFGIIEATDDGQLLSYRKNHPMREIVNGGFMVLEKEYLSNLKEEQFIEEPFNQLSHSGKLAMYDYRGFWGAVDTHRDLEIMNEQWQKDPKWKVWKD